MKWYLIVLSKYADFSGRARRSEYWYFCLVNMVVYYLLVWAGYQLFNNNYLALVYNLALFVPSLAVAVRRMHDVGKSGWYILIPIYNLILYCTEGTTGPNKYGTDPKRPELLDDIDLVGT